MKVKKFIKFWDINDEVLELDLNSTEIAKCLFISREGNEVEEKIGYLIICNQKRMHYEISKELYDELLKKDIVKVREENTYKLDLYSQKPIRIVFIDELELLKYYDLCNNEVCYYITYRDKLNSVRELYIDKKVYDYFKSELEKEENLATII